MSGPGAHPDDAPQDTEAAEYVLGLLPPAESLALAARALTDPHLMASIASWERHLAPLANLVDPVEPPPTLWRRLALATGSEPEPRRPARPRDLTRVWRNTALAASAVAAGLALFILARPPAAPGTDIAVLTALTAPNPVFLVRLGADGSATVLATGNPDLPPGRSLELWALRPGATTPESMGLLPTQGRARLPLALPVGTQLLVSQEPPGGSPTKQPTGPVVLHGSIVGL